MFTGWRISTMVSASSVNPPAAAKADNRLQSPTASSYDPGSTTAPITDQFDNVVAADARATAVLLYAEADPADVDFDALELRVTANELELERNRIAGEKSWAALNRAWDTAQRSELIDDLAFYEALLNTLISKGVASDV